jgi:hypothetical protein
MGDRILDYITGLRRAVVKRPKGWGSPEAVELQYLLLVQIEGFITGNPDAQLFADYPNRQWSGVLVRNGYQGHRPLAFQVEDREEAYQALQRLLPQLMPCPDGEVP